MTNDPSEDFQPYKARRRRLTLRLNNIFKGTKMRPSMAKNIYLSYIFLNGCLQVQTGYACHRSQKCGMPTGNHHCCIYIMIKACRQHSP